MLSNVKNMKVDVCEDTVERFYSALVSHRQSLIDNLRSLLKELESSSLENEVVDSGLKLLKDKYLISGNLEDNEIHLKAKERFDKIINQIELQAKGGETPSSEEPDLHRLIEARLEDYRKGYIYNRTPADKETLDKLLTRNKGKSRVANTEQKVSYKNSRRLQRKLKISSPDHRRVLGSRTDFNKHRRFTGGQFKRHEISPESQWPKSENGFFCLLRSFLTQGGERKRLTTAQLCEYVREWQAHNEQKLRRIGGACNWISRAEDWSAVTPYALHFLTAESMHSNSNNSGTNGIVRHTSRRLICPRPFVDSRPRLHQWSWLLAPPPPSLPSSSSAGTTTNLKYDQDLTMKFESETDELASLFTDWLRAPRGLGGLADAILSATESLTRSNGTKTGRRRHVSQPSEENQSNEEYISDEDSELSHEQGRLKIDESQFEYDGENSEEMEEEEIEEEQEQEKENGNRKTPQNNRKKSNLKSNRSYESLETESSVLDDTIPPPLFPTTEKLRPFTREEKLAFQTQEVERFSRPWTPFIYHVLGYYSVVGPLRSAPSAKLHEHNKMGNNNQNVISQINKARDHPLLRSDRPICISIAEIVRDAVACLPNGEGTRADITLLVQNSSYLLPNINARQLQQCVSSALDRLQGETSDPSLYFNANRRVWIYRHRHRTPEEFAEIHETRCAVNETKKSLQRSGTVRNTSVKRPIDRTVNYPTQHLISNSKRPNRYYMSQYTEKRDYSYGIHENGRILLNDRDKDEEDDDDDISNNFDYMNTGYECEREEDEEEDDGIPDIEELEAANQFDEQDGNNSDNENDYYNTQLLFNSDWIQNPIGKISMNEHNSNQVEPKYLNSFQTRNPVYFTSNPKKSHF